MLRKEIGVRLMQLRGNTSQQEIANKIGESRETIRNWENGTRQIKAESIIKLANYYNVTSDYILGLSDVKSKDPDIFKTGDYLDISEKAVQTLRTNLALRALIEAAADDYSMHREIEDAFSRLVENRYQIKTAIDAGLFDEAGVCKLKQSPAQERILQSIYSAAERLGLSIVSPLDERSMLEQDFTDCLRELTSAAIDRYASRYLGGIAAWSNWGSAANGKQ